LHILLGLLNKEDMETKLAEDWNMFLGFFSLALRALSCHQQWGRRLESWPNTAARLAVGGEWPSNVLFCTWWMVHAACHDGPHHLPRSGADILLNLHKTPSWVTSRKEGLALVL
jgi:hypothetical protein